MSGDEETPIVMIVDDEKGKLIEIPYFSSEYYDEECEAWLHNIANVKWNWRCWRGWHTFINASLHFETPRSPDKSFYSILLEAEKTEFRPAWGGAYGGIRYCKHCKLIDCIHLWESTVTYKVPITKFSYTTHTVSKCKVCKRRITRGAGTTSNASSEAHRIIAKVATELGKPVPSMHTGYGSGWFIEFPVQVSVVLDQQGVLAAEEYARNTFIYGLVCNR